MIFHVRQKVVCVDASLANNPWHRANPLVKNRVYEVRKVGGYNRSFVDIDGSGRMWEEERFRPIVETQTDISIFTAMLTPNSKERVEA